MQHDNENGVSEPSRRRLLKGMGALGGALALAGGCPVAHAQKPQSAPGTLSPDARGEAQPFYGPHQAGILTPQQASMMLVAFDVLASDKADLERLFRLLTRRFAFLTTGGPAPETPNPRLPPMDSGILGAYIAPDNLTMTLSVGHSLFDERYGLSTSMPKKRAFRMIRWMQRCVMAICCYRFAPTRKTPSYMRCAISLSTHRISSAFAGSAKGLSLIMLHAVKAKKHQSICLVLKTGPLTRMAQIKS